jgi:hypothetical protein
MRGIFAASFGARRRDLVPLDPIAAPVATLLGFVP